MYNIIEMALDEYQIMKHSTNTPSGDSVRVHAQDDVIVVSYVKDT